MHTSTNISFDRNFFAKAARVIRKICPPRTGAPQYPVWQELRDAVDKAEKSFREKEEKAHGNKTNVTDVLEDMNRFKDFMDENDTQTSVFGGSSSSKNYKNEILNAGALYRLPIILAWLWHHAPGTARQFYKYVHDDVAIQSDETDELELFASKYFDKIESFVAEFIGEESQTSTDIRVRQKICFVIMPFTAEAGRKNQKHFDDVYNEILFKACETAGFTPKRADTDKHSGFITQEILSKILSADMVLADLSRNNPNVMYELGIRHAAKKPVVLVHDMSTESVFNIKDIRTQKYPDYFMSGQEQQAVIEDIAEAIRQTAKAFSRKHSMSPLQSLPDDIAGVIGDARVFGGRTDIADDKGFGDAAEASNQLDMISLSAEVAMRGFRERFRKSVMKQGLKCRFVIYDPGDKTKVYYDRLIEQFFDKPSVKREQAKDFFEFANNANDKTGDTTRVQVKLLKNTQLFYNLWIAQKSGYPSSTVSHVSIYGYNDDEGGPAIRAYGEENSLFESLRREFDYVWNELAEEIQ